jgi:FtsH-binding integral membrane protein
MVFRRNDMKMESTGSLAGVTRALDCGLRKYMLSVFSHMTAGLLLTAVVAYIMNLLNAAEFIYSSQEVFLLFWLAPFGISIYLVTRIDHISTKSAKVLFFIYAAMLGLILYTLAAFYSPSSLIATFFVTSSMFLSMVIYGYSTEKDLTCWRSFLLMGLVGILIAGVVNVFIMNSTVSFVMSAIGVVVFTMLTAYDMQRIKSYYLESDHPEIGEKKAIIGALLLYLDFINIFWRLLKLMGRSRD